MIKGGMGGIGNLMKQAQQMQENMQKMQAKLAELEVEGVSGAGLVKVVMTGKHDVRRVLIDPSLLAGNSGGSRNFRKRERGIRNQEEGIRRSWRCLGLA